MGWQDLQPAGLSTGLCGTAGLPSIFLWHFTHRALPSARARALALAACGSWQARHSPFFTGACTAFAPPLTSAGSWHLAQSFPPVACTAKGLPEVAGAWQESQPPPIAAVVHRGLQEARLSAEWGSWQLEQVRTG